MSKPFTRAVLYYLVETLTFAGNVLLAWGLIHYGGVQYLVATTIGFIFQITVAFFINREWVFRRHKLHTIKGLSVTTFVQLFALFIALAGTAIGVELLGWPFIFSRILAGITAGLWGYVMDSRFTFGVSPLR